MKIGVMFGNPETTTGGQALKFYASVRMEIRRVESIKSGNDVSGNHVKVKVVKNKVAPPFRVAEFDLMFNEGISREGEIVDIGTDLGLIRKSGAFYYYGDQKIGQGRENAKEYLRQHLDLADEIEQRIRSSSANLLEVGKSGAPVKGGKVAATPAFDEDEDEDEE